MATKPRKRGCGWTSVETVIVLVLYTFEYMFQTVSRFITGPLSYAEENINGKIAIVTGAGSGIGRATAFELAKRGATVVLAGRNALALQEAADDIRRRTPNGKLEVMKLDLGDLKSIKKFALAVLAKFPRVDILVNNAGVLNGGRVGAGVPDKTTDGFELHFGTNYLGHFHLTNLLSDHLKKGKSSRIINVSSSAQIIANLRQDDLMSKGLIGGKRILGRSDILFANSKLATSYFTRELDRRLKGTSASAYAVCPGLVVTKIQRSSYGLRRLIISLILLAIGQTPAQGCETIVYCAVSKDCREHSGRFFRFSRPLKSMDRLVGDPGFSLSLWKASEKLVKEVKKI